MLPPDPKTPGRRAAAAAAMCFAMAPLPLPHTRTDPATGAMTMGRSTPPGSPPLHPGLGVVVRGGGGGGSQGLPPPHPTTTPTAVASTASSSGSSTLLSRSLLLEVDQMGVGPMGRAGDRDGAGAGVAVGGDRVLLVPWAVGGQLLATGAGPSPETDPEVRSTERTGKPQGKGHGKGHGKGQDRGRDRGVRGTGPGWHQSAPDVWERQDAGSHIDVLTSLTSG
ncbi:unnamed protein product [Discosporangium mesarthrocarpum]